MPKGLIHIYHGEGKGKTTAAIGLAVRAAGNGNQVLIAQFLKGSPSGEVKVLQSTAGITLMRCEELKKFSWDMTEEEKQQVRCQHDDMVRTVIEQSNNGLCDLLVLDEAVGACGSGLLSEEKLLTFLQEKPDGLEVVLTGRGPSERLLEIADYVTEMHKEKHPYDKGIMARKGVEF